MGVWTMPHAVIDDLRHPRIQPQGPATRQSHLFSSGDTWGVMAEFRSVKTDIQTSEAGLRERIQTSEAKQNKRTDDLKAGIKAMNEQLDRVLETLLAAKA